MGSTDFTGISTRYEQESLIQRSAAEKLISILDIQRDDDILDLGCGTGNLTRKLRSLTDGAVVGIDASEGMIREAEAHREGLDIHFEQHSAAALPYQERFSVIFCNSVFQWFGDPAVPLDHCYRALRTGGRMGIQAPAMKAYCPNFLAAIDVVAHDRRTAKTFTGFRPPWLFLETADDYAALFRHAGFSVPFARIETIRTRHSSDEVMTIFESGAAAGYLNQEYYATRVDPEYLAAFREIVKGSFRQQADQDGKVELVFNRIYLVAVK
jgi:trans-aconitate methyltransferase